MYAHHLQVKVKKQPGKAKANSNKKTGNPLRKC